jgi:L-fuconate dehydratase
LQPSDLTILKVRVLDVRFPTARGSIGSDAVNKDPDYSAAYCILETDSDITGFGLTFTLGRGTELCAEAARYLARYVEGRLLSDLTSDLAAFSRQLTEDNQFRWLGPEKGVIHLAAAALVNAVWDLYARVEGKPLWKLLADLSPAEIVRAINFHYIRDVITPERAVAFLSERRALADAEDRLMRLQTKGIAAYTTSAGWYGFSDEQVRRLCREAKSEGWTHFKVKVGGDVENDLRRVALVREEIGPLARLMLDANQRWDVEEAIERTRGFAHFNPWWMEEPTSPDDVLGHACIRRAVAPTRIATGEHCQNRVIFKQLFQAGAIDVCQIDSCRLAGVNENLAVILMAGVYDIPVCPHAGGVGLCEYVQHLSAYDQLCVASTLEDRVTEFVDHLHEHFVDPVRIVDGHYQLPQLPGYSIEMHAQSLDDYSFPKGRIWLPNWQTQGEA